MAGFAPAPLVRLLRVRRAIEARYTVALLYRALTRSWLMRSISFRFFPVLFRFVSFCSVSFRSVPRRAVLLVVRFFALLCLLRLSVSRTRRGGSRDGWTGARECADDEEVPLRGI